MMKKKLVFIAPHLSTGGMPQYLVKQIELIKDECEVYCVEWGDVTGGVLVVQRNKVVSLLGDRLITLGENKHELFNIINKIQPDIIHLQEIPELFMDGDVADRLYDTNRTYILIETSHDSGYDTANKTYLPDKFLMVSNYQVNKYKHFGIPCDVVEYPIENKVRTKTREQALRDLGLDPNLKHVINVGLFTPRKNQKEIIEYARMLQNYPIQFHFIGNQADNFKFYWEPLMQNFPSNCKWWNERTDVDSFYEAADLFLFTSRGHSTDMETMPLVIRESLGWKVPSLIYNLPVYMGYFDKYDTIEYLTEDLQKNSYRIAEKLLRQKSNHHRTERLAQQFECNIDIDEQKIYYTPHNTITSSVKVLVRDIDSYAIIHSTPHDDGVLSNINYWILPTPKHILDFKTNETFGGVLVEFYVDDVNVQTNEFRLRTPTHTLPKLGAVALPKLSRNPLIDDTVDSYFDFQFSKEENRITISYKRQESFNTKLVIKDKDSNTSIYWTPSTFSNNSSFWVMPIPMHIFNFGEDPSFSAFLVEFYNPVTNELQFSKEVYVKEATKKRTVYLDLKNPFDSPFINYNEMFVENRYDCYGLNNLDVVLDIGANNGLFSQLMLNQGAKKIYAFEPNEDSLINLRHLFRNTNKVSVVGKAVYTTDDDLEFFIDPTNTTIGSISQDHLLAGGFDAQKITVPAVSLKTFIQKNGLDRVSLVKMDIEGAEYEIIEQLEDSVYQVVDSFLIEYHDNTNNKVSRIINKLKNKGFDIKQIRSQNSKNNDDLTYTYETSPNGTLLATKCPEHKLLTVIVPSYNHEKYVKECIDSVLKQKTLFNFDILISDDCSTDTTYEIIQQYKNISNVRIQQTSHNVGAIPKRTSDLIEQVKSKYITILDADDYYIDEYKLQKQVDFLEINPEYVIHGTGWYITPDDSKIYERPDWNGDEHGLNMCSLKEEVTLDDNCMDVNYIGFGFMFRNPHLIGKKFPEWFFEEDVFDAYWALMNVLLEYGNAKNEDWIGGRYRITPKGQFGERDKEWKHEMVRKQLSVLSRVRKKQTNPILIVDAFLHNDYCVDTFKSYLNSVKKLDIPIMLVTNSVFDQSIVNEVDYILYDKNNRLFSKEYKDVENVVFYWMNDEYYISLGSPALQRHGLSVLSNLYHSTNLAKSLGYTHFYRIEYDCNIDNMENVKEIINTVDRANKKGLVYINQEKYVGFQIWYFELDYFTKYFPMINNEDDYIRAKEKFKYEKDFMIAEEFIYNMVKHSDEGFSELVVKPAEQMHTDYGEYGSCSWNTITSPAESDKMVNGCMSAMCRITIPNDSIRELRSSRKPRPEWEVSPESCNNDSSKVAFVTWNCSSDEYHRSIARITYPNGTVNTIEHKITGMGDHKIDVIDLIDGTISVEVIIDDTVKKKFEINKNTISSLSDVYQPMQLL